MPADPTPAERRDDLVQRLSDKALLLSDMADKAGGTEAIRLRAKAEGVDLALSFAQEAAAERDALREQVERLRGALGRIAQEPAPGSTLSCRNIARAALTEEPQP